MRLNHLHWISYCVLIWVWADTAVAQSSSMPSQPSIASIQFIPKDDLGDAGTPPPGRSGGRRGNCPLLNMAPKNPTLIALVPQKSWISATDQPSVWVYSPYSGASSIQAKVVLRDEKDMTRRTGISPISVTLPATPGIIEIPLIQSLEPRRLYRWHFTVDCDPKDTTNNPSVSGLIAWIPPSDEAQRQLNAADPLQKAAIYAQQGFWYDALALLAKEAPSANWITFLKSGDPKLAAIAQEKVFR